MKIENVLCDSSVSATLSVIKPIYKSLKGHLIGLVEGKSHAEEIKCARPHYPEQKQNISSRNS